MKRSSWRVLAAAGLCVGGAAFGQAAQEPPEKPVLGGPKVEERKIPGVDSRFGGAGGDRRGALEQRMPREAMRRIINALRGEDVAPELRLTPEQNDRIRAIESEQRRAGAAYLREHEAELRQIRETLGEERFAALRERLTAARGLARTDRRPPQRDQRDATQEDVQEDTMQRGDDAMQGEPMAPGSMTEEAARARLIEVFEGFPKPADTANAIWAVLSAPQQEWVRQRLDEMRKEADKRMTDAYAQRLMQERRDGAGPQPPARPFNDEMIPPPLRERLASLPPEQRERALQYIRERIERGEFDAQAARRLRARLENQTPKPAPDMDSVEVPPPEKGPGR